VTDGWTERDGRPDSGHVAVAKHSVARVKTSFVTSQKSPYHVTFDLDFDLEHTLDAGPSGDHVVQVWSRSSHLSGRSDLRKMFTDRQTDGPNRWTPHDCISSSNELKIDLSILIVITY